MKQVFLIWCFFNSVLIIAQDATHIKVETPKIVAKLFLGNAFLIEDIQIIFTDVISDSRCPENVTCVWAGEAFVLIDVRSNDELIEQREVTFQAGKNMDQKKNTLFESEKGTVTAIGIMPNLNTNTKLKKEAYYLQLEVAK
ncbi:MAG: hypothetical protein ABI295_06630 [Xanthomarina sp.]